MSLTLADVEKIAHLARLELSEAQKEAYLDQLSAILGYVEMINELDLSDVPPTTSAVTMQSVMREDVAEPCLPTADALYNAPAQAENQFLIQSILDE